MSARLFTFAVRPDGIGVFGARDGGIVTLRTREDHRFVDLLDDDADSDDWPVLAIWDSARRSLDVLVDRVAVCGMTTSPTGRYRFQ